MTDGGEEGGGGEGEKVGTRHTAESVGGIGWRWWCGGLLFQLGESNHLISSNCNESILSGEER